MAHKFYGQLQIADTESARVEVYDTEAAADAAIPSLPDGTVVIVKSA